MSRRVAIVCGEASGDILGADLIKALRSHWPDATFEGIGGQRMIAEGFVSHYAMDRLSVMGVVEPLKRLPELLRMRKNIIQRYKEDPPDVFIGIDSPDFTTNIELALREAGVKTVHYVSPSVWAWRQGRIHKIKRAVDLMLTLLPFEAKFYEEHEVPVCFVGHPLAYELAPSDKQQSRELLDLPLQGTWLAVMPGSRGSEVAMMAELYLASAQTLQKSGVIDGIVIPSANEARHEQIEALLPNYPELNVKLVSGQSHRVMSACDGVLLTSGTTALEAMLLNRPMVVAYRTGWLSYTILSRLVNTPFISLPNLVAGKAIVPELIQGEATQDNLVEAITQSLCSDQTEQFEALALQLKQGGGERAAKAIVELCKH